MTVFVMTHEINEKEYKKYQSVSPNLTPLSYYEIVVKEGDFLTFIPIKSITNIVKLKEDLFFATTKNKGRYFIEKLVGTQYFQIPDFVRSSLVKLDTMNDPYKFDSLVNSEEIVFMKILFGGNYSFITRESKTYMLMMDQVKYHETPSVFLQQENFLVSK